jgi:hypothetical protein
MRFTLTLPLLLVLCFALAGCITEPAPSEPHSYGQITGPAKAKKEKAPKKKKEPETTTTTVQPFDERQPQQ